jgi:hypothetical protein
LGVQAVVAIRPAEVQLSPHCELRFRDRVKPALSVEAAAHELERLLAKQALIKLEPPRWVAQRMRAEPADFYVLIGDCIALPVRSFGGRFARFVAVTCLVRTAISDEARRRRNERRRAMRARRRAHRLERRAGGTRRRRTRR